MVAALKVTCLSSVHAMADHALVPLLWGEVADPAAHQVQDGCILGYALPIQLGNLRDSGSWDFQAAPGLHPFQDDKNATLLYCAEASSGSELPWVSL